MLAALMGKIERFRSRGRRRGRTLREPITKYSSVAGGSTHVWAGRSDFEVAEQAQIAKRHHDRLLPTTVVL